MELLWNKNFTIFDRINKTEIMKQLKVTTESIRRANSSLVARGVDFTVKHSYSGVIVAKTNINGVLRVREISKEKINESYEKALKMYAEKL
ncbi:MAG: hypothetical protein RL108_1719 [Bacteroidota bacterium]|jgi:hypothetical protein